MSTFKAKKMLLIFQLNQALLYINNTRPKYVNHYQNSIPITYHQTIGNFQISYRRGRQQFLQQNIDVAVLTNLDAKLADPLVKKYFGRHFRNLLFVLPTNRSIYGVADQPEKNIGIKKDLSTIFNNFQGYEETNTFVISSTSNLIETYQRNDILIPQYCPTSKMFMEDPGMFPFTKYIKGILSIQQDEKVADLRVLTTAKQIQAIYNRYSHNMFTDKEYS